MNFNGTFTTDDQVELFTYSVQNTAVVNIFTTSFASGGFAPLLSLFDGSGNLVFSDNGLADNDCINNGTDPGTGNCYDSRMSWNSVAGETYTVALTEYDNFAVGPTLADGFFEAGNGDFTAQPPFNIPGIGTAFLLPSASIAADQRTGDWALTLESTEPTLASPAGSTVPEPSMGLLCLAGFALVVGRKRFLKT